MGRAYVSDFQDGDHGLSDETTPARGGELGPHSSDDSGESHPAVYHQVTPRRLVPSATTIQCGSLAALFRWRGWQACRIEQIGDGCNKLRRGKRLG
jgi:hypothetical protein